MCDAECKARFKTLETNMVVITTDIKWIKGLAGVCVIVLGAVFGVDLSGSV